MKDKDWEVVIIGDHTRISQIVRNVKNAKEAVAQISSALIECFDEHVIYAVPYVPIIKTPL